MRRTLLILGCCIPGLLPAETVMLRKAGNPAVVTFEYITQDEETVMVRIPGRDGVLVYRWDELDQDHAKTNNPRLWEERLLLIKPPESSGMKKKAEDDDPFAAAAKPNTPQDLSRNLQGELSEGLKGIPVTSVAVASRESNIDELVFWRVYEELRKLSGRPAGSEPEIAKTAGDDGEEPQSKTSGSGQSQSKSSSKSKATSSSRSPAQLAEIQARAAKARADFENDVRPFTGTGYLKLLSDATKARFAWAMLRRASDDRRQIIAALRRQDAAAAELSDRLQDKTAKGDIAVFRKAVTTLADSLEKVTREATAMESGLTAEAQAVLARLPR
jgi:hypothetical protein